MIEPRKSWLVPVPDQSERQRGAPGSIVNRQSADHQVLDELMRAYDAEPDADARGHVVAELAERALRHAFAEEVVLFPAYRRHLPDSGDALTAHIEGDHQQVNDLLHALQHANPRAPEYDDQVRRVFAVIRHDAHDEEDDLLPRLQQVASESELEAIGAAWEAARTGSPTRPHPGISRRPPWNALSALWLAVSDRVEDAVDAVAPVGSGRRTAVVGLLAGALGAAAMTVTEKAEQAVTGRTSSFMPAHTLQALLRRDVHDSTAANWVMHYGQGAAVGVLRALLAHAGVRGAAAWPVFTGVRLAVDQALENGTGVGAPPWTWSRPDRLVDVAHKAVYALVTGAVADRALPRR